MEEDDVKVIKTDEGSQDGQEKCPKCGATDISLNSKTGKLRCNFCRHEFEPEKLDNMETDIKNLKGKIVGSGATKINKDADSIVTLKCTSCGAEVIIDTSEVTQARCHWCRNTLSINEKVPNGAIPDVVLPFKLTKNEAKESIENFVKKRQFYAHPTFKKEFTTENVMGVYLPYMIVDINAHAEFSGEGEVQTRKYKVRHNDREDTRYDADVYDVKRDFDIAVEGLTVESSQEKLERDNHKTNNIINSIMPFDTENSVKWDANYLKGYSSEKRDMDTEGLEDWVKSQGKDIARYKIKSETQKYDRGISWRSEQYDVKGEQWKAAYLPVWLYSYLEKKGGEGKDLLHYVAVNARTTETMGSVPLHKPKLFVISLIIEIISIILGIFGAKSIQANDGDGSTILLLISWLTGFVYYFVIYSKYRNTGARHNHESETKASISNVVKYDVFRTARKGLTSSSIANRNDNKVSKYK